MRGSAASLHRGAAWPERGFAGLGCFVGVDRAHLTVDRIQLCLKLMLLFDKLRAPAVEALTFLPDVCRRRR